jgi:hypothetical protein
MTKPEQKLSLLGTWKLRSGQTVKIALHGVLWDKELKDHFTCWIGSIGNDLHGWNNDGNHLWNREFDLIERGGGDSGDVFVKKHG